MNNKSLLKGLLSCDFTVPTLVRGRIVETTDQEEKMMLPIGSLFWDHAGGWVSDDDMTIVRPFQPPYLFSEIHCPNCGADADNIDVTIIETVTTELKVPRDHLWLNDGTLEIDEFMLEIEHEHREHDKQLNINCRGCGCYLTVQNILDKMQPEEGS